MAYTASTYKLGAGTTMTVGSDVVTNGKIISMPTIEGSGIDVPHLGGVDCDVGTSTGHGEISVEIPQGATFTATLVIGTSYNITVTLYGTTAIINAKAAKLKSIAGGSVGPAGEVTTVYTFKFTVTPY